jgi:large subunit ribosomal protein L24
MIKSKKPSKQRKFLYQAPLHIRHKFLSAHLSKELRKEWNRRSLSLRKGDEVKVMKGKFKGTKGKISKIDLKELKIYIENVKRRKVSGEEVHVPIRPANLLILNPDLKDPKRKKILQRSKGGKVGEIKKISGA